jgi:hypothetical protein
MEKVVLILERRFHVNKMVRRHLVNLGSCFCCLPLHTCEESGEFPDSITESGPSEHLEMLGDVLEQRRC